MNWIKMRGAALALAAGLALLPLAALMLVLAAGAEAASADDDAQAPGLTFMVINTNNSGAGSLRFAINAANASPGHDTINFTLAGCPCVIALGSSLPTITGSLTIAGPGPGMLAVDGGGAYRVFDIAGGAVRMSGLTIRNGLAAAGTGAGIRSGAALTLTDVALVSNIAQLEGGGIFMTGALVLDNVLLSGNQSLAEAGGALYASEAVAISGSAFISNSAVKRGGALYASDTLTMTGSRLERNSNGPNYGGALYASNDAWITDTMFLSNTSGSYAGGAYVSGDVVLTDVLFENNYSPGEGGALYAGTMTATNTSFISNTAESVGGGAEVSTGTLFGGRFERNYSGGEAGGFEVAHAFISGTVFISNTAEAEGGGLYSEGDAALRGARFVGNVAGSEGGGLWVSNQMTVSASLFLANSAVDGGGLYHRSLTATVTNTIFARNSASISGTALYLRSAYQASLAFLTLSGTGSPTSTALVSNNGQTRILDSIIAGYGLGLVEDGGTLLEDYNLFFDNGADMTGGVGSLGHSFTGDPRFLNPAADDYHLGTLSAAIDAGSNAGVAVDFDGNPRPIGAGFDIGAFEAWSRVYLPLVMR